MSRAFACALALAVVPAARAGELDREVSATGTPPAVAADGGTELDRESPQPAYGWRWGGPYAPFGWGGFYYPARVSYFGFAPSFYSYSWYRPFGFYGYYSAFAYRPYFPAYYSPFVYSYWW